MQHHTLLYKNSAISYYTIGNGVQKLICVHGYGESAESYMQLALQLQFAYTIICIELPYHGKTLWKEHVAFTPQNLTEIIECITPVEFQKVTICGYSLGGRIALGLFEIIPHKIEKVILFATDGLHKNFWYWFATQTFIGRKLFAFTMQKPKWFFGLMNIGVKIGILNKSIHKFAMHYLGDAEQRNLLYKRWTGLRKFNPGKASLISSIKKNNVQLHLFFGRYDRIIQFKTGRQFAKQAPECIKVTVLQAGHQLLKDKTLPELVKAFY